MTALSLVSVIVVGALQALVFPVYFTVIGKPGLAGFVLSCLAAGMLIGAGVYAAVGMRGSRRTWFAIGLIGTAIGFAISATLASPLVVFVGATLVGLSSGMFSALIGVLGIERIPEALRGRIMGTQNSLMTLAPAIGIFGAAVLTSQAGVHAAAYTAAGIWLVLAVVALVAPPLRDLNARVAPTGGCDGRADRAASGSCHASRR
ncbi:MAG: MFS transporter [Bifidobacteriaceae bacterium]|jgi:MFS family permease|nr:MFS transporter [Bifidobacteriaceae bacterium]